MNLIEIVDKEEKIFFDTSVISTKAGFAFLARIYDTTEYEQLDDDVLEEANIGLGEGLEFLKKGEQKKNLFTLPEVIEELGSLQEGVIKKQKYLNEAEKRREKGKKTRDKYNIDSFSFNRLNEIGIKVNNLLRIVRKLQFKELNSGYYSSLRDMFITIGSYLLKKKSPEDYGYEFRPKFFVKNGKKHTDEKLIATALYNCLSGSGSSIITADVDLMILLNTGLKLIGAKDIKGNHFLIEHLKKNIIKIYHPSESLGRADYVCKFSTENCEFYDTFKISYLDNERNSNVKRHIEHLVSKVNYSLQQHLNSTLVK